MRTFCFQYVADGAGIRLVSGAYASGETFADACAAFILDKQQSEIGGCDPRRLLDKNPVEAVMVLCQGAVEITETMTMALAWRTDLKGLWPKLP